MEKRKNVAWRVRRKSGGWEKKGVNEGLATSAETSYESRKAGRGGEKQRSKGVLVERRRETMERRAVGSAAEDDRGKRREKRRHRRILIETSVRLIKNHCRSRSRGEIAVRVSLRGLALARLSIDRCVCIRFADKFRVPSTRRFVFPTLLSNQRLNAANSSEMQEFDPVLNTQSLASIYGVVLRLLFVDRPGIERSSSRALLRKVERGKKNKRTRLERGGRCFGNSRRQCWR